MHSHDKKIKESLTPQAMGNFEHKSECAFTILPKKDQEYDLDTIFNPSNYPHFKIQEEMDCDIPDTVLSEELGRAI